MKGRRIAVYDLTLVGLFLFLGLGCSVNRSSTIVEISGTSWLINGELTNPGSQAEGLLMNTRMVNSTFEDSLRPEFDAEANTDEFIAVIPDYVAAGINAFTLNLQGGMPGYEGAINSAFNSGRFLRAENMARIARAIMASDQHGAATSQPNVTIIYRSPGTTMAPPKSPKHEIIVLSTVITDTERGIGITKSLFYKSYTMKTRVVLF